MNFRQTFNRSIDIETDAGTMAAYRYGSALPKPCVHPIATPAGHLLTGFQMSDHVWHRGLWFTIKFINGENFWEENPPAFGSQTSTIEPIASFPSPGVVRIQQQLDWTSAKQGTVIRERRMLDFVERDGLSYIDWTCALEAQADLLLDRTPYTTWGGYSGLTFRGSRGLHGASYIIPGGESVKQLIGDRHPWVFLNAGVDGSPGARVSIGLIDHPSNPRAMTPWYGKSSDDYCFINAAFLFHEPMRVENGQTLNFRYRICYRDGAWAADEFDQAARIFRDHS